MKRLLPRALRSGDSIALAAPAGICDPARTERAIARLTAMGFAIRTCDDLYRSRGYLAGDDATRARELMEAFADPEVSAIFPVRGGFGVTRILDRLDFDVIRNHPKILTGFSDVTALHLAIERRTGLVTFHSPNPMDGIGMPDGLSDLSARTFWRAILADHYQDAGGTTGYEIPLTDEELDLTSPLVAGTARGRLTGGNLALVCALMGTAYELETTDAILLLEDVDEPPYRIDRFLSQLRLAGKLDSVNGIILGQFTDCNPRGEKPSLAVDEVFRDYFAELGVPVLQHYPVGHARDNATLPLGATIDLNADTGRVTVLDNPVRLSPYTGNTSCL